MSSTSLAADQAEAPPLTNLDEVKALRQGPRCSGVVEAPPQIAGEQLCDCIIGRPLGGIDYSENGTGPTLVLAPGSCSTGAAWRPIVSQWQNTFRCVTTSLLGYGRTAERRTADDTDISHEAEVLETVVTRTGGPVHLVGHSFGGLAALAVALRKRVQLLSSVIIEAPAPDVLRQAGEHKHYQAFRNMTEAYIGAFEAGEAAAIESMIDFYGGRIIRPVGQECPTSAASTDRRQGLRVRHWRGERPESPHFSHRLIGKGSLGLNSGARLGLNMAPDPSPTLAAHQRRQVRPRPRRRTPILDKP